MAKLAIRAGFKSRCPRGRVGSSPTRRMRSAGEVERVLALTGKGLSSSVVADQTGVPSATVRMWRRGAVPTRGRIGSMDPTARTERWHNDPAALPSAAYAYLLGMYLGDGDLATHPRGVFRLRVALDSRYPLVFHECAAAMSLVLPTSRVLIQREPGANFVRVGSYSKQWIHLLPQHGPGRKHMRRIELERWQATITHRHPEPFLRGLFHSDGSRHLNKVRAPRTGKRYAYVRYEFSNRSQDIKDLLCEHLDLLGIEWRRMNRWNVSVARRKSVLRLDAFVGPKG